MTNNMEKIKKVKASQIPDAINIDGFKAFGIKVNADGTVDNVKVPMDLLKGNKGDKGDTGAKGEKGTDGTVTFEDLTPAQKESLRGLSAFEVWDIMNGGNKTEAQFFDFIQSPATDAKNDYATVVKPAIQAQGAYAQEQGDYAKAQGDRLSAYELLTTEAVNNIEYNEITF